MNKRIWLPIVLLFLFLDLLAAGVAVWWFMFREPDIKKSALLEALPEQTVALLWVPDAQASATRWKATALQKIWDEPDIQALLAKPLAAIPENPDLTLAQKLLAIPEARDLFVAVVEVSPKPAVLFGLRIEKEQADADKTLAEAEERLKNLVPDGKSGVETRGETIIRSYGTRDLTVYGVNQGEWRIWGTQLAPLEAFLQQLQTASPERASSLADSATYRQLSAVLPSAYDGLFLVNFAPVRANLAALTAGVPNSAEAKKAIESLEAAALALRFEGLEMKETFCVLNKESAPSNGELSGRAKRFTAPETLALYKTLFDATALNLEGLETLADQTPGGDSIRSWVSALNNRGVTSEGLVRAFGPELAVQVDWGKGMMQPRVFLQIDVKDAAEAKKVFLAVTDPALTNRTWKKREIKPGSEVEIFSTPAQPGVMQPVFALGLGKETLVAGMGAREVELFFERPSKPATPETDLMKWAGEPGGNLALTIDSAALFTQTYSTVKSALAMMNMFGGASLVPTDRLPANEVITKHLTPFVLRTRTEGDVIVTEASGPITTTPAALVLGAAVTGAVVSGNLGDPALLEALMPKPATTPQSGP